MHAGQFNVGEKRGFKKDWAPGKLGGFEDKFAQLV